MDSALMDVKDMLKKLPPLDLLADELIEHLVKLVKISYFRKSENICHSGTADPQLYIIRKGAFSQFNNQGELIAKYAEGNICADFCREQPESVLLITDEDTLLYSIDWSEFQQCMTRHQQNDIIAFFQQSSVQRLSKKMQQVNTDAMINSSLYHHSVDCFYRTPVVTISPETSIQKAAMLMAEKRFSCLLVMIDNQLLGIITDKDISRRCVAKGMDIQQPVSKIMTKNVTTLDIKSTSYDALMIMMQKNIRHLPVMAYQQLKGIVTITDLMNHDGQSTINITRVIHKAVTINELVDVSKMIPQLQVRMVKLGMSAGQVGKSISAITNTLTVKLINMAEIKFGSAPVPFAWVAAGSQARQEQFIHSDQDNALIISNDLKPEDKSWFSSLAKFVSDGLAKCGFIYCPGNVMATNEQWNKTQREWATYFHTWITTPDPKALMHCSIFFDLSTIYGDVTLLGQLRKEVLNLTKNNTLFIAHLTQNALSFRPPLGFFRNFVLIQNGKNKNTLDLKHNGIVPIVDLARIYALSEGIEAVNTIERLQQAAGSPSITKPSAQSLIDAYEFLSMLRMQHQAKLIQQNQIPDNYISPKEISPLEREHLKGAFKVIKTMQDNRQSIR